MLAGMPHFSSASRLGGGVAVYKLPFNSQTESRDASNAEDWTASNIAKLVTSHLTNFLAVFTSFHTPTLFVNFTVVVNTGDTFH